MIDWFVLIFYFICLVVIVMGLVMIMIWSHKVAFMLDWMDEMIYDNVEDGEDEL